MNRATPKWSAEKQYASVPDDKRKLDLKLSGDKFTKFLSELAGDLPPLLISPSDTKDEALARFQPMLGISHVFFDKWPRMIKKAAKRGDWQSAVVSAIHLGQWALMMALNDTIRARAKKRKDGATSVATRHIRSASPRKDATEFVNGEYQKYRKTHGRGFLKFWEPATIHGRLKAIDPAAAATLYRDGRRAQFVTATAMQDRMRKLHAEPQFAVDLQAFSRPRTQKNKSRVSR